ncbi:MAG: hypothetical protein QNK42_18095 [Pseudodonghicola sp.]|nr:hypothetical protein [Pseudodonghicola sp.]
MDVVFARSDLPLINSALVVKWDQPTPRILEVHSHFDHNTFRAVPFQSMVGLAQGVSVHAPDGPVCVPVSVTTTTRSPEPSARQITRELGDFEATLRRVRQKAITVDVIDLRTATASERGAR